MKTFPKLLLVTLASFLFVNTNFGQCPTSSSKNVHVVQKGESLYRISKKYNMTVDELAAMNNINPLAPIAICQELQLAEQFSTVSTNPPTAPTSSTVKPQGSKTHTVKSGESIAGIAYAYGYTEERFRRFNGLTMTERAMPGLVLKTSDCDCENIEEERTEVTTNDRDRADDRKIPETETRTYTPTDRTNNGTRSNGSFGFEEDPFGEEDPTPSNWKPAAERPTGYNTDDRRINTGERTTTTNKTPQSSTRATTRPRREFAPADEFLVEEKDQRNSNRNNRNSDSAAEKNNTGTTKDAARYMTAEEIEMVKEINLLRSNPTAYIKYVEDYKQRIIAGKAFGSVTTCDELISELRRTPQLSTLRTTECIYNAAKKHGQDQRPTGDVDHIGTDGSYPWDRVRRECVGMTDGSENLVAGPLSIRDCIMILLLDESVPNRGHRRTLLKSDWKFAACYKVGTVGNMPNNWIQKFGR